MNSLRMPGKRRVECDIIWIAFRQISIPYNRREPQIWTIEIDITSNEDKV